MQHWIHQTSMEKYFVFIFNQHFCIAFFFIWWSVYYDKLQCREFPFPFKQYNQTTVLVRNSVEL